MVEEEPQPTLESVGTPEGGREGEGEGEKEGEEEEEGEEEVATGSGDNTGLDVVGNGEFLKHRDVCGKAANTRIINGWSQLH